jgi:hypothetical protein
VIFIRFGDAHVYFRNAAETGTLFGYSMLVSTIAFVVYLALLRKDMKNGPALSQRIAHQA